MAAISGKGTGPSTKYTRTSSTGLSSASTTTPVISGGLSDISAASRKLIEYSRGLKKLTGFRLVALMRAAARFVNWELVEGGEQENEEKDAA
jgi:hypothetical protein